MLAGYLERYAAWGPQLMKRWLFNLVAAVSLLLSLTAAAGWAMSYARPLDWHLLGIAHSADLTRVNLDQRTVVFMMPVNGSHVPRYGYWDALWARSQSGRLSLVAQAADYGGNLRAVYASPPSLIVDLPGPARTRAVAFGRMPNSRPWARRRRLWLRVNRRSRMTGSTARVTFTGPNRLVSTCARKSSGVISSKNPA